METRIRLVASFRGEKVFPPFSSQREQASKSIKFLNPGFWIASTLRAGYNPFEMRLLQMHTLSFWDALPRKMKGFFLFIFFLGSLLSDSTPRRPEKKQVGDPKTWELRYFRDLSLFFLEVGCNKISVSTGLKYKDLNGHFQPTICDAFGSDIYFGPHITLTRGTQAYLSTLDSLNRFSSN